MVRIRLNAGPITTFLHLSCASPSFITPPLAAFPSAQTYLLQSMSDVVIVARASLTYLWMCMLHCHSFVCRWKSLTDSALAGDHDPVCNDRMPFLLLVDLGAWEGGTILQTVSPLVTARRTRMKQLFSAHLAPLCVSVSGSWLIFFPRLIWTRLLLSSALPSLSLCMSAEVNTSDFSPDFSIYAVVTTRCDWSCFFLFSNFHSVLRAPRACWREWFTPLIFTNCASLGPQRPPRWAWRVPARPCFLQTLQPRSAAGNSPPFSLWRPLAPASAEATRGTRCTPLTQPSAWLLPLRRWAGLALSLRMHPRSALCHCLEDALKLMQV